MKTTHLLILLICLISCNQLSNSSVKNFDYEICKCLASTKEFNDPNKNIKAKMDCLTDRSGTDKDKFMLLLSSAFLNCDGFAKKMSELNLSASGLDTINFSEPNAKICESNLTGKWKDVLSNDSTYSILRDDYLEHYENAVLVGKWRVLSKQDCQITFVVTEQKQLNPLPPNIGDTIIATTIGVTNKFVKNITKMKGLEVLSIGVRLPE